MKIIHTLLLSVLISFSLNAQSLGEFLDYLEGIGDPAAAQVAADSFINTLGELPFIEGGTTAHFIYNEPATQVLVVGDFNFWDPGNAVAMTNFPGTNFRYHSQQFEVNARLDYKFVVDGSNWILDPLNPNTITGGFGPNSELAMPEYEQPWEIEENPDAPKGSYRNLYV